MLTFKEQYYKIIQHRQANPLEEGVYGEKHHIYPKSLFPQFARAKWNIVKLTAEEHYKCHYLLVKWFEEECDKNAYEKMVHAWNCFHRNKKHNNPDFDIDKESAEYAEMKEKRKQVLSSFFKDLHKQRPEWAKKAYKRMTASETYKENHHIAVMKNQVLATKASVLKRTKPFEIDGIRFEHILEAAKYFKVGAGSIHRWLHNPDKYKRKHTCKYI